MIGSLRRKVFWSILLSAAGVLLAILLAINVLKLVQTASKRESILDSGLRMPQAEPGPGPERREFPGGGRDQFELLRSVSQGELGVLLLDESGGIVSGSGGSDLLDEETLSAISAAALADADGRGRAGGWEYKAVPGRDGTVVSFLDTASLRRENAETALLSLVAFAVSCCLFALMARLLSQAIVRPVEENIQAQKRFVADASHELKTPLSVIDANASVLERSVGQTKWLDYIKEQTGRMSGLVNELLQLSDLEESKSGDAPRQREPFDAAEAILTAALPFESVAFERGVVLETETPDRMDVLGSRQDLEKLAAILIDNAVKHSAAGGTVRVTLSRTAQRHGWLETPMLELRVVNSGEDIPPEALEHIFDRFYRADESRSHKDGGYGLGLAIAKGIAEKYCGSISVSSKGGTTEFTFWLPIR